MGNFSFIIFSIIGLTIFICFLSIIAAEIVLIIMNLNALELVFWIFDLFLLGNINHIIFGIPLHSHKKFAIAFILIFSGFFQLLITYVNLLDDNYDSLYKTHIIFIPIIIIGYLCISILRYYSWFKIKWLLDQRYLPLSIFLIIYSSLGVLVLLIICLITTYVKCADISQFNGINYICRIAIKNVNNNIEYYYDNFSYFFEQLWRKERTSGANTLYLILYIIKSFLNALRQICAFLLIKKLSPEYYQCSFEIYYCIYYIFGLIKAIIKDEKIKISIFYILEQIFALISNLIYLELIEIKVYNLNQNVKRYIEMRSLDEYNEDKLSEQEQPQ